MAQTYQTKEEVFGVAQTILHKTLRELMPSDKLEIVEKKVQGYGANRKGYLGDLVEEYVFGLENNGRAEADFLVAGVELKTSPLKRHDTKEYVSKERLVFSMIDYEKIILEKWETSSFLEKNKLLLLMFYLFELDKSILDFEFKFVHMLNLLQDISAQDVEQIKKDWEFIVSKIRNGEAHLLSEGETYYLGACTKAKNSASVRVQPNSETPAKPRAFSLKQTYLNYIIQKNILGNDTKDASIYKTEESVKTIEEVVNEKFKKYIGKTDKEIMADLSWVPAGNPKNFKRLLANRILTGTGSNNVVELEKANVTLRTVTLEHTGTLREAISFPAFDYVGLEKQAWFDEETGKMSDFHEQLEINRFLFVVFQKKKDSDDIVLKKVKFWNFPVRDMGEVERVFNQAIKSIRTGKYEDMPKVSESEISHVRPHAKDSSDTILTPQGTQEIKRCFWLNAKYIQKSLEI